MLHLQCHETFLQPSVQFTGYMYGKLYSNNDVKYVIGKGKVHVLKLPKGIHNNASYQNVTNSFLSLQLLMPLSHPSH